jgi:hypothetical protein
VISTSQVPSTCTQTENKHIHIRNIHALCGLRTQDPGFPASEDSACLRSLGYFDRTVLIYVHTIFKMEIFLSCIFCTVPLKISALHFLFVLIKGKGIPVTDRGGPLGCETSKLPHFLDNRLTDGDEAVSLTRRPPLLPGKLFN